MKTWSWRALVLACCLLLTTATQVQAQDPITLIIKEAITRVIKAVDLKIQRLQNETIWLQEAQKKVENAMSQLKLEEIRDWAEKQRELYQDYFEELKRVKTVLTYYRKVQDIIDQQLALVQGYKRAVSAVQQDRQFTADEVVYIERVLHDILDESVKNLDALALVLQSFTTQMSDGQRLAFINEIASAIEKNYGALRAFHNQNKMLSLARASDQQAIDKINRLYGIEN
jgi:hypothetical protein